MEASYYKLAERTAFDSEAYCALYPDIAKAIADGTLAGAWDHYDRHGRDEGRFPCRFDEAFYLRSYPRVAEEITRGTAATPLRHYVLLGRGRGYLAHPAAPRAANPAAPASRFGGLWIDDADALDQIDGRQETGRLTEAQAALLRRFVADGFIILPGAVERRVTDAVRADLDRAFDGGMERLRFQGKAENTGWHATLATQAAKALDIHHFSPAVRRLIFAPAITAFLALIFESKVLASQTLGFWRGSAQAAHQDTTYVVYSLARQFAASWVALEDVTMGAGELFYYPGSHRMPDFLFSERYKSVSETIRMGIDRQEASDQARSHGRLLEPTARQFGLEKQVFAAKQGDVLIWHADLVHGGHPVSPDITRKSIVTHYCPKHVIPLFGEQHGVTYNDHDGHLFTSSHYAGIAPTVTTEA